MIKVYYYFYKIRSIFILFCCLTISSCKNKEKENEENIKSAVANYLNDEFFKKDFSLKIIDLKVNKIDNIPMDSLIRQRLREVLFKKLLTLMEENPNYGQDPNFIEYSNSITTQQPKFIKLKSIQKLYSSDQIGKYAYVYVKATYTNMENVSKNYLNESCWFALDNNNKVIDTAFGWEKE